LEEGFDKVLELADVPNFTDLINVILDALGIPTLSLPDISDFDFDFLNLFDEVIQDLVDQFNANFLNIDRSMFDPSRKLQEALNRGQGDWPVHISTSETGLMDFDCEDSNKYPVVVKAEGFLWSCTQDMSASHRFPCGLEEHACTNINYIPYFVCPSDPVPDGSAEFAVSSPDFSPAYFHAIYYCIPEDVDPEIMPKLQIW
jgi:hypothetical protein